MVTLFLGIRLVDEVLRLFRFLRGDLAPLAGLVNPTRLRKALDRLGSLPLCEVLGLGYSGIGRLLRWRVWRRDIPGLGCRLGWG